MDKVSTCMALLLGRGDMDGCPGAVERVSCVFGEEIPVSYVIGDVDEPPRASRCPAGFFLLVVVARGTSSGSFCVADDATVLDQEEMDVSSRHDRRYKDVIRSIKGSGV